MKDQEGEPGGGRFRKKIRLRHAVAMYGSSVLGSGILILPGLAARIAGPASILAWVLLSLSSYPFAYTFASLSSRRPESGGIYSFAKEAFGLPTATIAGWLFALWVIAGAPAVTLIAASYLGYAFPINHSETLVIAFGIFLAAFLVNYRGIVMSTRIQLAIILAIIGLLVATIAASLLYVRPANFLPLFPRGIAPVGTAAALIFWSYLGYENVSNVAEEFENPERDFQRGILLSVFLIGGLYIAIAFVTIGTLAYATGGNIAPFASIISHVVGGYGAESTAILAVFIIFGTANAYTAGMSRVFYAVSRDGGFPRTLGHINPNSGVPERALIALFVCAIPVFLVYYFFSVDLETALLVPSGAAILVYVIGSASGVRLFRKKDADTIARYKTRLALSGISLAISLVVLAFVGPLLIVAVTIALAAMLYSWRVRRRAGVSAFKSASDYFDPRQQRLQAEPGHEKAYLAIDS